VKTVKEMIMNDRRITTRKVTDDVDISIGSCHEMFSETLCMKRVVEKICSKIFEFRTKTAANESCLGVTK